MFWIIFAIYANAQFNNSQCNRSNILNEYDCANFVNGSSYWNNNQCLFNATNSTDPGVQQETDTDPTYCNLLSISVCADDENCALVDNECIHFTGCTPFTKDCDKISIRCISNGEQCIEVGECEEYENETSCQYNMDDQYCYWDKDKCITAKTCEQLPELVSDKECRSEISTCTVTTAGKGCVISGQNCSDQQNENQCKTNLQQTQKCFWNGSSCLDYVCGSALQTLTTDAQCKEFLSTCTTKENGGCVTRSSCQAAVEKACVTDSDGDACYWNGEKCIDKICENAPDTYTTNTECEGFLTNCITDGSGCVEYKNCDSAKIEDACTNKSCYWYDNKCQVIQCSFAPDTLKTNSECNQFLSGCVTILDGGCMEQSDKCADYDVQEACLIDEECFWNDNNECVDRTCENAPITLSTTEQCQNYNQDCIFTTKCVLKTCENLLTQDTCTQDYNDDKCTYIDQCYSKECSLATYQTAKECYDYLDTCTLNESETGCTQLPAACSSNKKKSTCYVSFEGLCGWSDTSCIARSCGTADSTYTTNEMCDEYFDGCVLSNTTGCMELPELCADRQKQQNCHFGKDDCVWGGNLCQSRSCETAKYEITTISDATCRNYFNNCILNNASNNCQEKTTCDQLVHSNCLKDAGTNGTCLWNGLNCIQKDEILCIDIKGAITHTACNTFMNTCTVNSNSNGCIDLKDTCEEYTVQGQCVINSDQLFCKWTSGKCVSFSCSNAPDSFDYATDQQCSTFQSNCTYHSNIGGCVSLSATCDKYLKEEDCYMTSTATKQNCFWYNNVCKTANTCSDIKFLNSYATSDCEEILPDCKANTNTPPNGCIAKICSDYPFTNLDQCIEKGCSLNAAKTQCIIMKTYCGYYTDMKECYYANQDGQCIYKTIGTEMCVIKNYKCSFANGDKTACENFRSFCTSNDGKQCASKLCQSTYDWDGLKTLEICQNFDSSCTAQLNGLQCTDKTDCNSYGSNTNLCYYGSDGYCTKVNQVYGEPTCGPVTSSDCILIWVDYFVAGICEKFLKFCTDNPNYVKPNPDKYDEKNSQCIEKTCQNKPAGTGYTHAICQAWSSQFPSCTNTFDGTGCTDFKDNCSQYSTTNCGTSKLDGKCNVVNGVCVPRTCSQAPTTLLAHDVCQTFLNTCTVGRIGGCEPRKATCSLYTNMDQCTYDINHNKCWVNKEAQQIKCVQFTCDNIDKTSSYSTRSQCQAIQGLDCIQRYNNVPGCQDNKVTCEEFLTQPLCTINKSGQDCQWNTNKCLTKTCTSAPSSLTTVQQCVNYYTLSKCTTKSGGGCTFQLQNCSDYTDSTSCTITLDSTVCGYNQRTSKCELQSCLTAPLSFTTHQQCNGYMDICTVSKDLQGCQEIPDTCEEMTEAQCKTDSCVFTNKCVTRTCTNKPANFNGGCTTYLNSCLDPTIKCKDAICEYYNYTTDDECNKVMDSCTSDGTKCIPRKNCIQYTNQVSCVQQLDNKKCQWISSTKSCVIRSCSLAPTTLKLYSECQEYLSTCTVKISGGCMNYDLCTNYKSEEQCQIDSKQQICVWDTDTCRYQECKDYTSNCDSKQCIVDYKRKVYCMKKLKCSEYEYKLNCIIGTDGSCLWINDKCYKYSECQDIKFTTHDECQDISEDCTTDGTQCVPITFCAKTNTTGGCQIGIDGECIEVVTGDTKECVKYDSCNQIVYTTHEQCHNAKSKCTSDGVKCISLDSCNSYTEEISCVIDAIGKVITSNQITSTGKCIWNSDSNVCNNQNCSDLQGTTNSQCESQLYSCTSDGTQCIPKVTCSDLKTQQLCSIAKSQDSYCFWENEKCRQIGCEDIKSSTSVEYCKDKNPKCTYDGTQCIAITKCKDYVTAISCNSKGTDGLCSWIPPINGTTSISRNQCKLMDSCKQSNQDKQSCIQANDKCYFKPATNDTASLCEEHTCTTYYQANKQCNFIYNWDESTITFCQLQNNNCVELTAPTSLSADQCYKLTGYTYTYDTNSSKCTACAAQRKNATINPNSVFATQLAIFIIFIIQ